MVKPGAKLKKVKESPEVITKVLISAFESCDSLPGTCGVLVLHGFPIDEYICDDDSQDAELNPASLTKELLDGEQRHKLFIATLNNEQTIAQKFLKANGFMEIDNFDNPSGSNMTVFAFREV